MPLSFKSVVVVLLSIIALINGVVVYKFYSYSSKPCLADKLLTYATTSATIPASLKAAQQDINLILAGKQAVNAKLVAAMADGGSALYVAGNYEITIWHAITTVDGIDGFVSGYTLRLKNGGRNEYTHTWFQPKN